jgi:type IV pilus biogenesis protein CpaD/CtpE
MKTTILSSALLIAAILLLSVGCASNPTSDAVAREAFATVLAEYQRQHPIHPDK